MRENRQIIGLLFIHFLFSIAYITAQTTTLVSVGTNGKLVYTADIKGNMIPDFSGVGYMNSEAVIPTVAVVKTVTPVAGDNRANVQAAINEVAALPLNANGFRGAILFKKGTYNISDTIFIKSSGIVLRGEGTDAAGTVFIGTKTAQFSVFYFAAASNTSNISASKKAITDAYLPIGAKKVTVTAGHSFVVGDNVFVHRVPNQAWIDFLTMAQWGWTPSGYDVYYERKVMAVNGNQLTIDAPVMDVIDPVYATGEVLKFTSARIEKCGIENMRINSTYVSETDENHGWKAVTFDNITNAWARQLEVYYFGYSAVHVETHASFITVEDCKMLDAKSTLDGGRRYSFNVDGQRCLVQNCFTRQGRHDYVNGSQTAGPNVFYNCTATDQKADMGPHHRWSTGILFDNITGTNDFISVQNRTSSGTGHGWSGAQTMFWNCDVPGIICQDPQGDHRNWAIGCVGNVTNVGHLVTEPLCIVESRNRRITAIPSLFKAQLADRLGTTPVADVNEQKNDLVIKSTLVHDVLDISINENTTTTLNIFNIAGQKVLTTKAQGEKQLNISTLPAGLYIIQTETGGVGRFVKQ
jgi:hypothetical protein